MDILSEEATSFASLCSGGQLLKGRICSSRSKFLPLRVNPISESYLYLIQRSKQEFLQDNKTLFSEKGQRAFMRAGTFIRIIWYISSRQFGVPFQIQGRDRKAVVIKSHCNNGFIFFAQFLSYTLKWKLI